MINPMSSCAYCGDGADPSETKLAGLCHGWLHIKCLKAIERANPGKDPMEVANQMVACCSSAGILSTFTGGVFTIDKRTPSDEVWWADPIQQTIRKFKRAGGGFMEIEVKRRVKPKETDGGVTAVPQESSAGPDGVDDVDPPFDVPGAPVRSEGSGEAGTDSETQPATPG